MERGKVVLVDKYDHPLGEMEKLAAHQQGLLHRAFSVFIFNDKKELLLQKRAQHKYHGGGLWTNTCCSHPQLDENVLEGAQHRLLFEMGISCPLVLSHHFIYKAPVENDLIEHELDYVYIGFTNEDPTINSDEVQDFQWQNIDTLIDDIQRHPADYTFWFKTALPQVLDKLKN